jgi:sec-independent protein translocase protein TatB
MFDVGFAELVLLFVIGLLILGPERLPRVAAQIGRWVGRARRTASQLRHQLEREIALNDIRHPPSKKPAPPKDPGAPKDSGSKDSGPNHDKPANPQSPAPGQASTDTSPTESPSSDSASTDTPSTDTPRAASAQSSASTAHAKTDSVAGDVPVKDKDAPGQ